jgi:hypothetical protein
VLRSLKRVAPSLAALGRCCGALSFQTPLQSVTGFARVTLALLAAVDFGERNEITPATAALELDDLHSTDSVVYLLGMVLICWDTKASRRSPMRLYSPYDYGGAMGVSRWELWGS